MVDLRSKSPAGYFARDTVRDTQALITNDTEAPGMVVRVMDCFEHGRETPLEINVPPESYTPEQEI